MEYYYCNPTGNITILVKDEIPVEQQPEISKLLCEKEPTCEQVGFIYYDDPSVDIRLRMAGGEFCGNATMTTAAYHAYKSDLSIGTGKDYVVSASGTKNPVDVSIIRVADNEFYGKVSMPKANRIENKKLVYKDITYILPIVMFDGMYHIIMEEKMEKKDAEEAIKKWCKDLSAPALGIMFLKEKDNILNPIVYVPAVNSIYWENSCASGTTATGIYLFKKYGREIEKEFKEPGGILTISVKDEGKAVLSGRVVIEDKKYLDI